MSDLDLIFDSDSDDEPDSDAVSDLDVILDSDDDPDAELPERCPVCAPDRKSVV